MDPYTELLPKGQKRLATASNKGHGACRCAVCQCPSPTMMMCFPSVSSLTTKPNSQSTHP
eukprot:scaffold6_cov190-Alexandrium_tamarense.AAC.26